MGLGRQKRVTNSLELRAAFPFCCNPERTIRMIHTGSKRRKAVFFGLFDREMLKFNVRLKYGQTWVIIAFGPDD